MKNNLISINEICIHHHIELNFIQSLKDFGLIKIVEKKSDVFLSIDELIKLEKYLRLAEDLEINLEGLHAVSLLLSQMEQMQKEIAMLKKELNYYKQFD